MTSRGKVMMTFRHRANAPGVMWTGNPDEIKAEVRHVKSIPGPGWWFRQVMKPFCQTYPQETLSPWRSKRMHRRRSGFPAYYPLSAPNT